MRIKTITTIVFLASAVLASQAFAAVTLHQAAVITSKRITQLCYQADGWHCNKNLAPLCSSTGVKKVGHAAIICMSAYRVNYGAHSCPVQVAVGLKGKVLAVEGPEDFGGCYPAG